MTREQRNKLEDATIESWIEDMKNGDFDADARDFVSRVFREGWRGFDSMDDEELLREAKDQSGYENFDPKDEPVDDPSTEKMGELWKLIHEIEAEI